MVKSTYLGIGGHDTVINNLCSGLNKIGYDTAIGAFSFIHDPPDHITKVELNRFSLTSNDIDGHNFDIIHTHESLMNYYSLLNKKPWIYHYHGANGMLQKINLRMSLLLCRNRISKIITVSNTSLEYLKNIIGKIPINVIYNGVDTDLYNTNLPSPYKKGSPQLLFVGNLHPSKNVGTLIDSMNLIIQLYPNAHLQIVGDGTDYKQLKQKIKSKKLEKHVELVGKLYKDEIRLRYSSCDIFVSASTVEAHSLTAFEAMACGKPSILSNIPAHKEILNETNTGLTFSTFDICDIRDKLQEVYEKKDFFSSNARKFAEQYQWSYTCEQVANIYNQIM